MPRGGWASLCTAEVTENSSFLDAAIADFTIFIKTTPRNVRAYWGRARPYQDKGEYDRAIVDSIQALWLRPQSAMTYSERGMTYASNGDYDKAVADFTKSIQLSSATGPAKDLAKV